MHRYAISAFSCPGITALTTTLFTAWATAGGTAGPDITVGDISSATTFGAVGDVHSYALGITACNAGDAPIEWNNAGVRHPVFATQLYRLADGRFEQIGLSWVFHEFFPLEINACGGNCTPSGDPQSLGAGCANVNSASIAGSQTSLGLRTEVSPEAGVYIWPPTDFNMLGDAVYKRLQASRDDLQTPGARYFFEAQYASPDDSGSGNALNNVSYREVSFTPATLSPQLMGQTAEQTPAIFAWADADPHVFIGEATDPVGGRYVVASRAYPLDTGEWRYEYAVYNQNAARTASAFEAPHMGLSDVPRVYDLGFHDVAYHSGETVDGTDWEGSRAAFAARWEVGTSASSTLMPNEIRWGTLYNFRFSSFDPPVETTVRLTLASDAGFGDTIEIPALAAGPSRCGEGDFAQPYYVLDLADIQLYLTLFQSGAPEADIRPPFSVLDLSDLQAFIAGFIQGCS